MSDGPVYVKFPDKMTVKAPETDNLIESLTQAFKSLSKMLQEGFKQIADALQTLKQLPELVTALRGDMNKQLTTMFQHEMEAQILTRYANILTLDRKRETISQLEREKTDQLPRDRQRITERYSRLLDDVAAQSARQVEQLDGHAFELLDQIYPRQVQERFSYESMPVFGFLAQHASDAADARATCLDEGLTRAIASVDRYLARRNEAIASVDVLLGPKVDAGWYELPVLFAEIEDQNTGERELHMVGDPETSGAAAGDRELLAPFQRVVAQELSAVPRVALPSDDHFLVSQILAKRFGVPPAERDRFEAQLIYASAGDNR